MYGKYSPVYCIIDAEGRKSSPSFGSKGFDMDICVGPSIKKSRTFAKIIVKQGEEGLTSLYIDGKLIKEIYV